MLDPLEAKPRRKPRTQAQRTLQTRMQILQAAAQTFGKLGYAQTRVEDILAASGVSRPTFYRFFGSKEQVFDALDESASLSLLQMVRSAVDGEEDYRKKIEKGVEAYLRWQCATGPVAQVLRQESLYPQKKLAPRRESTMGVLADLFREEVQKVYPADYDPLLFSTLITAIEHVGASLATSTGRVTDKQIRRGKKLILHLIGGVLGRHNPELTVPSVK